jgi:NADPH:quinone reductase-like Zn-dependent oxidoreductase
VTTLGVSKPPLIEVGSRCPNQQQRPSPHAHHRTAARYGARRLALEPTTPADMAEQHALLDNVAGLVDAGKIRSTVAEHFGTINAANLKRAHALLETGKARGKIVLEGF